MLIAEPACTCCWCANASPAGKIVSCALMLGQSRVPLESKAVQIAKNLVFSIVQSVLSRTLRKQEKSVTRVPFIGPRMRK